MSIRNSHRLDILFYNVKKSGGRLCDIGLILFKFSNLAPISIFCNLIGSCFSFENTANVITSFLRVWQIFHSNLTFKRF